MHDSLVQNIDIRLACRYIYQAYSIVMLPNAYLVNSVSHLLEFTFEFGATNLDLRSNFTF